MNAKLERSLGPWQASSLVVGTIIGTGIFLKTTTMTQLLGGLSLVFWAWVLSGLLSYAGALTYAELASHFPESGGEYVILRATYGRLWAFIYGWVRFTIASPATIAAYAVGASTFLSAVLPLNIKLSSIIFILLFSAINCLQVKWGARVQAFLTALKVFLILGLFFGIWFFGKPLALDFSAGSDLKLDSFGLPNPQGWSLVKPFLLAMVAALWAYDGWNNLPMAAGEIKNPKRNIPIALGLGVFIVGLLYISVNWAYFQVLSAEQVASGNSSLFPNALPVATMAAQSFLGSWGVPLLSVAFVVSAIGAMNGSILTSARVPFAMARDRLFFSQIGLLEEKSNVPVVSILVQAVMSCAMALSGSFDQLTDYVVVSSWFFYGLTTSSIFKIKRQKKAEALTEKASKVEVGSLAKSSSYSVPFYPILPILFILVSMVLTVNSLLAEPMNAVYGLMIVLLGLPVYYFFKRKLHAAEDVK